MKILIVEDIDDDRKALAHFLQQAGHTTIEFANAEDASSLEESDILSLDFAVLDWQLPRSSGLELGKKLFHRNPRLFLIMLTAWGTVERQIEIQRCGGFIQFVAKPGFPEVRKVIEILGPDVEQRRIAFANLGCADFGIYGTSKRMADIRKEIAVVAPTDVNVLILGPSGTGKELVAAALHSQSNRRNAPYVPINCAAVPKDLLESEMFGHERGAFTGAAKQRIGRFETAAGGTIFLDEIGEMSQVLQAKLLRFLQEKTFTRVGGNTELSINARVIAATNVEIEKAISERQLRADLYYRLQVVEIKLPPLNQRGDDVLLLAEYFLEKYSREFHKHIRGFTKPSREILQRYHWPGNVRELENAIQRAIIKELTHEIQATSLSDISVLIPWNKPTIVSIQSSARDFQPAPVAMANVVQNATVGSPFWEALKRNDFRLWRIDDLASVRSNTKIALEAALSKHMELGWEKDSQQPLRQCSPKRQLEGFRPPAPFKIKYVDPISGELKQLEMSLEPGYHPEPNYIRRIYKGGQGVHSVNNIPIVVSAVCRFAVENRKERLRDAFRSMSETVIDEEVARVIPSDWKMILGEQNLWDNESKTKNGGFRGLNNKYKDKHPEIQQLIKKYFPDYLRQVL